jgi:hypothetical protein
MGGPCANLSGGSSADGPGTREIEAERHGEDKRDGGVPQLGQRIRGTHPNACVTHLGRARDPAPDFDKGGEQEPDDDKRRAVAGAPGAAGV